MARVFLFAFVIGVTIYALLDWAMNSKKGTPGGLSRWLWLAVIILLPVIGPLAWIVLRLVGSAEMRQSSTGPSGPERRFVAPDDDTEFLDDWSRRIARRQRKDKPASTDESKKRDEDEDPGDPTAGKPDDPTPR